MFDLTHNIRRAVIFETPDAATTAVLDAGPGLVSEAEVKSTPSWAPPGYYVLVHNGAFDYFLTVQ